MQATPQNTIFVTALTHTNQDFFTVMSTARKNDVFVHVLKTNVYPPNLWRLKMVTLHHHLKEQKSSGKEYFFFFDAYDVIFLKHRDEILRRFNEVYNGITIFNADYPRSLYPYTNSDVCYAQDELKSTWLINWIQNGDTETSRMLNTGLFAGRIDDYLSLFDTVCLVKSDFLKRQMPFPLANRLYEDLSVEKVKQDDQLVFWLTMLNYPNLFHIDSRKELLTVAATGSMMERNLEEYRTTSRERPLKDGTYIGSAVLLHSAGGSVRNMGFVYRHQLHEPVRTSEASGAFIENLSFMEK
ncbi:MAG: hypothetical protein LBJ67_18020 [Planctomycetaceae bacterium]|jgi:hypothetical protein|nr:hypothetical protein [Planctomycetaceae bacterium]